MSRPPHVSISSTDDEARSLQPSACVRGIRRAFVTAVNLLWRGSDALTLIYRGPSRHVSEEIHRGELVPAALQARLRRLTDLGVVESIGRRRGTRYLLPRRFYGMVGKPGTYTRRRGLDRETNKELPLRHLREADGTGSRMDELQQVLPSQSRAQLKGLLGELREEGRVRFEGERPGTR
jgi:hypothetical protein